MKKHLPSRVLSLLLVLALFVGLVVPMNVSADSGKQNLEFEKTDEAVFSKLSESVLDEESAESDDQYAPDDNVRVSIVLEEASTIERFGTADIATNASAVAYRSGLKSAQVNMASKISAATGTKLDVEWNLTLAANLISANVRYDSIKKIEKIPGVKSVVIETRYEPMVVSTGTADPNMATSSAQIGSNTAWAAGYTGAGSKVAVIDTGIDRRTIVSGIAEHYTPEELVGRQVLVLVNLEPRELRGVLSQGMILMAQDSSGKLVLLSPADRVDNGATIG